MLTMLLLGGRAMAMTISSPAFGDGYSIPAEHTCDGRDVSPALAWTDPPAGTQSFALIVDDPDAPRGPWVHWVVYQLPATARELPGDVPAHERLDSGALQGLNDFRRVGYGGPCPPPGNVHRYMFKLYALDNVPALPPKATKAELLKAMHGHILQEIVLTGLYQRAR